MKKVINIILCFLIITGFLAQTPQAQADTLSDLQNQANSLNAQIKTTQDSINNLQKQASDTQSLITNLDAQSAATQSMINLQTSKINNTTNQINQTQAQIAQKTAELKTQKAHLYETMTVYYENSNNQSTLETIIGSNSLSDAIDRAKYLEAIGANLADAINKINKIMADLQTQNQNLEAEKTSLEAARNDLADQQRNINILASQKQAALNQLTSQKNQSQQALSQLYAEKDNVSAQIYELRRAQGGYTTGGTGGYPYSGSSTDGVDPWGFYYRQCTSYAAWYFNNVEGKAWRSFRQLGIDRSSNGGDWADLGRYLGYSVSSTPRPGAIASWPAGGINAYGHVAIVQSVNANGTINVSEYNWVPYAYDERRNVSPGNASFIY